MASIIPPSNPIDPEDYYKTEEGYIVFKASYHLKRGYCCQSGCRHCPYGFDLRTGKITKPSKPDDNA
ncbi:MAG: DUF5522 domain-containing protein [Bacteroidia bacterium]|jgi:hypothetical protein|nr:hypothetical protein [Sphingobacteriia bacterium]